LYKGAPLVLLFVEPTHETTNKMTSFMGGSGGISFNELLKDGAKHFSGVDEAVMRNIEACKKLSASPAVVFARRHYICFFANTSLLLHQATSPAHRLVPTE
jgi:hypothetical protein